MSSSMITASACCEPGLTKDTSPRRPSSAISEHSSVTGTPQAIRDWLTSSLEASRASRSHAQAPAEPKPMSEICGPRPCAVYKSSDPNMCFSKMFLDCSETNPLHAYVAGLIDGEGCIGIQSNRGRSYYVEITIGMSVKAFPLLKAMGKEFGGTVIQQRKQTEKWSAAAKWRIGGASAIRFLTKILPYLVLKCEQAKTALQLEQLKSSLQTLPNGRKSWTKSAQQQAKNLKKRMHDLNKKGPEGVGNAGGWYLPEPDLFGTWLPYSGSWPRAGMTVAGEYFQVATWERPICAKGFGFSASDPLLPSLTTGGLDGGSNSRKAWKKRGGLLPTLSATSYGSNQGGGAGRVGPVRYSIEQMAKRGMLPSLTASDHRYRQASGNWQGNDLVSRLGGKLNPTWCDWYQGFPIGWTALQPLATHRFQQWLRAHGKC